jgi:hypothetical protein
MSPEPRRERGTRVVSVRDEQVWRWIARRYAIRYDQLERLLRRGPARGQGGAR